MKRIIVTVMIAVGLATPAAASALTPAQAREPVARDMAAAGAAAATRCANETVAIHGTQTALRVMVRGASCSKARSLIRTYFHDIATKGCQEHGTACIFVYRRGWDCSFPIPALHIKAFAGCDRAVSGRFAATVSVYKIGHSTTKSGKQPSSRTACASETVTVRELKLARITLRFVDHGVSCRKAHSLIRAYFRHEARPGYCHTRGVICAYVSKGWTCSLPLYPGEGGGDFAGCTRQTPPATVRVFARKSIPGS